MGSSIDWKEAAIQRRIKFAMLEAALLMTACQAGSARLVPSGPTPTPLPQQIPNATWNTYQDSYVGFRFQYPSTWVQDPDYPNYFTLDLPRTTTLYQKEMYLTGWRSQLPCNNPKAGGIVEEAAPEQVKVTVNGIHFIREQAIDRDASAVHDWTSYSTVKGEYCINLVFILHSSQASAYATPPPEFDHAAESVVFDEILNTFHFDW